MADDDTTTPPRPKKPKQNLANLAKYAPPMPSRDEVTMERSHRREQDDVDEAWLNGFWDKGIPYAMAISREDTLTGSVQIDHAKMAIAMREHLKKAKPWVEPEDSLGRIARYNQRALRKMRDKDGNRLDFSFRKRLARERAQLEAPPPEAPPAPDNG